MKDRGNVKLIMAGGIFLICLMAVGYAAFQTDLFLSVSGTAKKLYAADSIRKMASKSDSFITDSDGNIRYTGSLVNNYVCLADESPCQDKNLFRIIGSFKNISNGYEIKNRVKLIKANEYSSDYFDDTSNSFISSNANTVLNTTYYNSLDNDVKKVFENAVWNLGGGSANVDTSLAYSFERGNVTNLNNVSPKTWTGLFGLMYLSDYGFASKDCFGSIKMFDESQNDYRMSACKNNNWLYSAQNEWLMSPDSSSSTNVLSINSLGYAQSSVASESYALRPTLFLKSNTFLVTSSHDGSSNNPYIIKLDE